MPQYLNYGNFKVQKSKEGKVKVKWAFFTWIYTLPFEALQRLMRQGQSQNAAKFDYKS